MTVVLTKDDKSYTININLPLHHNLKEQLLGCMRKIEDTFKAIETNQEGWGGD